MSAVYTLGIDVGSTESKCIILKDGKEIVAKYLIDVGAGTSGPQRAIDAVLEAAGMTRDQMAYVLATGYGRNSLMGLADKQMSCLLYTSDAGCPVEEACGHQLHMYRICRERGHQPALHGYG